MTGSGEKWAKKRPRSCTLNCSQKKTRPGLKKGILRKNPTKRPQKYNNIEKIQRPDEKRAEVE